MSEGKSALNSGSGRGTDKLTAADVVEEAAAAEVVVAAAALRWGEIWREGGRGT